jgi:hypothetical protein
VSVPEHPRECDRCNVARITGRYYCREHARRIAVRAGHPDALARLDRAIANEERRAHRNAEHWASLGGARDAAPATGRPVSPVCPPGEHFDPTDKGYCLVCGENLQP